MGYAGFHAGGLQALLQAVVAEVAFIDAGHGTFEKVLAVIAQSLVDIVAVGRVASIVGAGHGTGLATHADVGVDADDAVGLLPGGASRADAHTGRVVAMVTELGKKLAEELIPDFNFFVVHIGAVFFRIPHGRLVFHGASGHTGIAADAGIQIDEHGIFGHDRFLRRARGAR
ncbi:hypothetical protein GGI1_11588 [Acidithiobacillus sp. GGI-221]|nr:hypothetical protein GGI1_11588 [Acidithiobacillus sp. GGI-221]